MDNVDKLKAPADVQAHIKEQAQKLAQKIIKHLTINSNDYTLYILKAHLIVESEINDFLQARYKNPRRFQQVNLRFMQRVNLFFSHFEGNETKEGLYEDIVLLNSIRNKLAHQLESSTVVSDINKLIERNLSPSEAQNENEVTRLILALASICSGVKAGILTYKILDNTK